MQVQFSRCVLPVLLTLLLLGASCAGDSPGIGSAALPQSQSSALALTDPTALLPPVALLRGHGAPPRSTSLDQTFTLSGSESTLHSADAVDNGDGSLSLTAPSKALRFAIFEFDGLAPTDELSLLSATLSNLSAGQHCFLALADFASQRWLPTDFTAATDTETFSLDPQSASGPLSPSGSLFVAVLFFDGAAGKIQQLQLFTGSVLQPPASLSATQAELWDTITLDWSAVAGADGYDIFYKRHDQGEQFFGLLAQVDAPATQFLHKRDSPLGEEADYNVLYDYRVRSRAAAETSPVFSPTASGLRFYSEVLTLSATDRKIASAVELDWNAPSQPGLENISFDVFRDDVLIDSATGLTYSAVPVQAHEPDIRDYYIVPQTPDGPGVESTHDLGSLLVLRSFPLTDTSGKVEGLAAATIDGRPAFAWYDSATDDLHYLRATTDDPGEFNWEAGSFSLPAEQAFRGRLCMVDWQGRPALVAGIDDTNLGNGNNSGLLFLLGNSAVPQLSADWGSVFLGDSSVQGEPVLAQLAGRLSFVYYDDFGAGMHGLEYFRLGTDPLNQLDWNGSTVEVGGLSSLGRLALGEAAGRPFLIRADADALTYYTADSVDVAAPGDWTKYAINSANKPYSDPCLTVFPDQLLLVCRQRSNLTDSQAHYSTVSVNGLDPQSKDDWSSSSFSIGFQTRIASVSLCMEPDKHGLAVSYGGASGEDILDFDTKPGLDLDLIDHDQGFFHGAVTFGGLLCSDMSVGDFLIPVPPSGSLEDLPVSALLVDGRPAFAMALSPASDPAKMQLIYFHIPSPLPQM